MLLGRAHTFTHTTHVHTHTHTYMYIHIPMSTNIHTGSWLTDLKERDGAEGAALVETWDIRTTLSESEAKTWASIAAAHSLKEEALKGEESPKVAKPVWVVFFIDGEIVATECPFTSKRGFEDWSYQVVKLARFNPKPYCHCQRQPQPQPPPLGHCFTQHH